MIYGNIQKIRVIHTCNYNNDDIVVLYINVSGELEIMQVTVNKPRGSGYNYAIKLCDNVEEMEIYIP